MQEEESMRSRLDLAVDFSKLKDHADYRSEWERVSGIEIKMVEQYEECKHCVGETFRYGNPYERPEGVCNALLHVIDLYTWRIALGFPSWNPDDPRVFRLHCPDPKGTVWEARRV
jgi:uncharacterized repeat protein (TIGR04076 family)